VIVGGGLAAVAGVLTTFALVTSGSDADTVYREAQKIYASGRLREALPLFKEAHQISPLSATAIHARYFEAIIYFREEEWKEAERRFRDLVETFPEAPNVPEALYHIGICRVRLGDTPGAVEAWEEVVRRFPEDTWARHSKARLGEVR
jgi:TolA-binding protein